MYHLFFAIKFLKVIQGLLKKIKFFLLKKNIINKNQCIFCLIIQTHIYSQYSGYYHHIYFSN